ncbi:MAG: Rpn family recombination-promoting nuclease/putative transposase [Deltaproteobacteria bacterium]|nr:Rpn family recombination-promoting nuclease/putative transposase [Deltaproteobacteria bacterium]
MKTSHHDRFFKEVFSGRDVAQDFLSHYLPDRVRDVLDLEGFSQTLKTSRN